MNTLTKKQDWGRFGPAMLALPNDRWRAFAQFYLVETYQNTKKNNLGAQAAAARHAGFGNPKTKPRAMAHMAWRVMRDERMVAAVREESQKYLRAIAPEAVKAVHAGIRNPGHKDHARFVSMALDRADPVVTHQQIDVTHKHLDPDQDAIEELRAVRKLGTTREKLLELFGHNGLERVEALEAADTARRAQDAKMIEGEAVEVK